MTNNTLRQTHISGFMILSIKMEMSLDVACPQYHLGSWTRKESPIHHPGGICWTMNHDEMWKFTSHGTMAAISSYGTHQPWTIHGDHWTNSRNRSLERALRSAVWWVMSMKRATCWATWLSSSPGRFTGEFLGVRLWIQEVDVTTPINIFARGGAGK